MAVILGRLCSICFQRQVAVPATYVAHNANNHQWYECDNHDDMDHDREFHQGKRTTRESADAFFERHFGKR